MLTRTWQLLPSGDILARDTPIEPVGWSLLWYCFQCGKTYCRASVEGAPWKAINGCCSYCRGNRFSIPGSLETVALVGSKLPPEVNLYELSRELVFTTSPDHPWNRETTK